MNSNTSLDWNDLQAMPTGAEKCRQYLAYANTAIQNGDGYEAVKALREAMEQISWTNPGIDKPLLDDVYLKLCGLCCSHDECAWEIASQVTGDYRIFLEEHKKN